MSNIKKVVSVRDTLPEITPKVPIISVKLRHFSNLDAYIKTLSLPEFNPKTDLFHLIDYYNRDLFETIAKQTCKNRIPLAAYQRILIPAGIAVLEIYTHTDRVSYQQSYMNLTDLKANWNAFSVQFAQSKLAEFSKTVNGIERVISIIQNMLYVHIEPGRSYIEFRIPVPYV